MGCGLLVDLNYDGHPLKPIVFRPETRIQSVQTTDGSLEQRFRFDSGGVLDSKAVHIFHDAIALEH